MNIKKFLPAEDYILESPLTEREVNRLLLEEVNTPVRWGQPASNNRKPYYGMITGNTFRIRRMIKYQNSFLPVIKGEIHSRGGHTTIHISMKLSDFSRLFMFVWLGVLGLICFWIFYAALSGNIFKEKGFSPVLLIPFGMFIFGWLLIYFGFKPESRKSKKFLEELFSGVEVSGK